MKLPIRSGKCHCTTLWNADLVHLTEVILFPSQILDDFRDSWLSCCMTIWYSDKQHHHRNCYKRLFGVSMPLIKQHIIYHVVHCSHVSASTCPHPTLTLNVNTLTVCSIYWNPLGLGQDCWLATQGNREISDFARQRDTMHRSRWTLAWKAHHKCTLASQISLTGEGIWVHGQIYRFTPTVY